MCVHGPGASPLPPVYPQKTLSKVRGEAIGTRDRPSRQVDFFSGTLVRRDPKDSTEREDPLKNF